ncbi:MAG: amidase [Rhodospirillaceae bacterium]|nr:amidase [Rhodospirillaceae bacterium]
MSSSVGSSDARGATLDLTTASIADVQAAFKNGLTAEALTQAYLARIAAYDKQGPAINAIITLNPRALEDARKRDAERKAGKVRGPLHGIPVVLKDNIDTVDMPTTAGSQLLAGSIPPDDAVMVKKLRAAGAIILAKVNLSEFAASGGSVSASRDPEELKRGTVSAGYSTMGLQTRNPHDPTRGPAGSSGGTGAAVAAVFAQVGIGTDTGGSIRSPSAANGIVGLRPTLGLISRTGLVPLSSSLDTGGPMTRSVYDTALTLGVLTGVDTADKATLKSKRKAETDYLKYLKPGALRGARLGIARDFTGRDAGTDKILEEAIAILRRLGAVIVDPVTFPDYLLQAKSPIYHLIVAAEFKAEMNVYLKTLKPGYPRSFDEIVALANDPRTNYRSPEKAYALKYTQRMALDLDDPQYLAAKNEQLAAIRAGLAAIFAKHDLDAIVYPTASRPAAPIERKEDPKPASATDSATNFASEAGLPDLAVPAGMTENGLPVTLSFLGPAWSEAKLIGFGYDLEHAAQARRLPKFTPALPTDALTYDALTLP